MLPPAGFKLQPCFLFFEISVKMLFFFLIDHIRHIYIDFIRGEWRAFLILLSLLQRVQPACLIYSAGCITLRAVRLSAAMKRCDPSQEESDMADSSLHIISEAILFPLLHSPSLIARVNITDFYFSSFYFLLQSCLYLIPHPSHPVEVVLFCAFL